MKKKAAPFVEYISESTMACLVVMVQGNLLALTVGHLLVASQTGIIAGAIAAVGIVAAKVNQRWKISLILGFATAVVDYFVHPGMLGPAATEAVVTGAGAAVLSYLVGSLISLFITSRKRDI
jgi:hypothetical protein